MFFFNSLFNINVIIGYNNVYNHKYYFKSNFYLSYIETPIFILYIMYIIYINIDDVNLKRFIILYIFFFIIIDLLYFFFYYYNILN